MSTEVCEVCGGTGRVHSGAVLVTHTPGPLFIEGDDYRLLNTMTRPCLLVHPEVYLLLRRYLDRDHERTDDGWSALPPRVRSLGKGLQDIDVHVSPWVPLYISCRCKEENACD